MKKTLPILAVSLAANAALLVLYFSQNPGPAPASTPTAGSAVQPPGSPTATASRTSASGSKPAAATVAAGGKLDISGGQALVARMRAAGFPENLISSAVQGQLMEQYYARYSQIMGLNDPIPPFWSSSASNNGLFSDPARQKAQRELSNEMTAAMKDLLGPDFLAASMPDEARASYQRQYGDLPAEKIFQLQEVMQDYSLKQQEVGSSIIGGYLIRLPEDNAKLAQIESDRRAAIVALLTPQELENYDLRSSNSASQLKSQLAAFEPSEEEYRTLFKVQQAFDEKYPSSLLSGGNTDLLRERSLAQQKLKEEMAAALPPGRAEAYLMSQENGASTVARIVNRLNLPIATVGQVMAVQKEIQAQATALRTDRTLSVETRNQALAALQDQAVSRIGSQIGANGLAAYKSQGGTWIQSLVPPPPIVRGGTAPAAAGGRGGL